MSKPAIKSYPNYVRVFVNSADSASTTLEKVQAVSGAEANGISLRKQALEIAAALAEQNRVMRGFGKSSLANYLAVANAFDEAGILVDVENGRRAQAVFTASTAPKVEKQLVWDAVAAGHTAAEIMAAHLAGAFKVVVEKDETVETETPEEDGQILDTPKESIADVIARNLGTAAGMTLTLEELATIDAAIRAYSATVVIPESVKVTVAA